MRNIPGTDSPLDREARELRRLMIELGRRRSLRDPLVSMCEELQLSAPQLHALLWLGHEGALTMGDLARHVNVTEKTVTGLVDRLERDGLLQRERDPADRRVVHVKLTAEGVTLARKIDADVQSTLVRMLGLLDPADRKALFRIIEKLTDRLAEPAEGSKKP